MNCPVEKGFNQPLLCMLTVLLKCEESGAEFIPPLQAS